MLFLIILDKNITYQYEESSWMTNVRHHVVSRYYSWTLVLVYAWYKQFTVWRLRHLHCRIAVVDSTQSRYQ